MSPIANLFWNARERRLRAGWRLLVFLVMLLVVAAVEGRVRAGLAGRLPDLYEALVRALVFALLIAAALYLASRVLDHRRMSDYGFHFSRRWWTDLGFGVELGALLRPARPMGQRVLRSPGRTSCALSPIAFVSRKTLATFHPVRCPGRQIGKNRSKTLHLGAVCRQPTPYIGTAVALRWKRT